MDWYGLMLIVFIVLQNATTLSLHVAVGICPSYAAPFGRPGRHFITIESWQVQCLFESHWIKRTGNLLVDSPRWLYWHLFANNVFHTPFSEVEVGFPLIILIILLSYMSSINSLLDLIIRIAQQLCESVGTCMLSVLFMTNHGWLGSCLIYLEVLERITRTAATWKPSPCNISDHHEGSLVQRSFSVESTVSHSSWSVATGMNDSKDM